jgi:hypothetical protein
VLCRGSRQRHRPCCPGCSTQPQASLSRAAPTSLGRSNGGQHGVRHAQCKRHCVRRTVWTSKSSFQGTSSNSSRPGNRSTSKIKRQSACARLERQRRTTAQLNMIRNWTGSRERLVWARLGATSRIALRSDGLSQRSTRAEAGNAKSAAVTSEGIVYCGCRRSRRKARCDKLAM